MIPFSSIRFVRCLNVQSPFPGNDVRIGRVICRGERAALADTLVVFSEMGANDLRLLHLHAQLLLYKVNGLQDGEEGIPLAAAGTADLSDSLEGPCRHLVGKGEGLHAQRRRAGGDGDEHPGADPRAAGAPEAAGAAGDLFPAIYHFPQSFRKVQCPAGVMIGRQQGRADHDVVLRPVHVAERQGHHLLQDLHGVFGALIQAQTDDGVQPCGVAVIADVMAPHAAGLAVLFFAADGAFHLHLGFQIFQRRAADQAFVVHVLHPSREPLRRLPITA